MNGEFTIIADIAAFEETNPDGAEVDSNPYGFVILDGTAYVVDAGGNTLLSMDAAGNVDLVAVFPALMAEAPPFLGLPPGTQIPAQSVPTSVAIGTGWRLLRDRTHGIPIPGEWRAYLEGRPG